MATTGSYAFDPSLGELVLYAYNLCGVRNTAILTEHMESARMAANMLQSRWSAQGVNLWAVDLQSITLVQGQATYSVDPATVVILDGYVTQNTTGAAFNRVVLPISRSEYASYPNPNQQGVTTVYWFDRLLSPTVTLWPVPDGTISSFSFYRLRQIQDAALSNGQQVEIPYYFFEAFAYGLAQRLAMIWAPDRVAMLKPLADEAYTIAASQNVETAQQYISPQIAGYFRP